MHGGTLRSPLNGIVGCSKSHYAGVMKTEEILRYEAEFKAMQEAFGTCLLIYEFPRQPPDPGKLKGHSSVKKGCLMKRGRAKRSP